MSTSLSMTKGPAFRIGKLAMAAVGTVWTFSNLYSQLKHFLSASNIFFYSNLILFCVLVSSLLAANLKHLLIKRQTAHSKSILNSITKPQLVVEDDSNEPSLFGDVWRQIVEHEEETEGDKLDGALVKQPTALAMYHQPNPCKVDSELVAEHEEIPNEEDQHPSTDTGSSDVDHEEMGETIEEEETPYEEDQGEVGKDTLEEAWKVIVERKQRAKEKALEKSNTWDVTPNVEQMRGKQAELGSLKSLTPREKGGGRLWGWRKMEVELSHEELNHRAETFINRIKNNIRLERLDSYNRFLQTINGRYN